MPNIFPQRFSTFAVIATVITIAAAIFMAVALRAPKAPPNILLIVADDLGYSDLQLNNPELTTPNLNTLAEQGVQFTRHYTDATCSPTRVGLLTGLDPASLGFRPMQQGISADRVTLPKIMSSAGYNTFHIGKWHVGDAIPELSPIQTGFDDWYGFLTQSELAGPSLDGIHFKRPRYKNPWLQTGTTKPMKTTGHLTDIVTEKALEVIDELNKKKQPWFLNLWYYAPHAPVKPAQRFAEKYPDTVKGRYQALIEQLDFSVGRITKQLERLGISDNTLLIFVSDNGGTNREMPNNQPLFGKKAQLNEGGLRTPMIWRWPGQLPGKQTIDDTVSYLDLLPTLAHIIGWDTTELDLDGKNIWPSVSTQAPFPQRFLHWEYLAPSPSYHTYSVLDKSGRWRLSMRLDGKLVLYDVENSADTDHNFLEQYPEVAQRLEREYEQWRRQNQLIAVNLKAVNDQGAAIVTGDGVQRSPGYSGLTFAIGATPDKATATSTQTQYIANQPPFWQLNFKPGQPLTLTMLGETLTGPVLAPGQCFAIVVSSFYSFSRIWPESNISMIDLYVNETKVDSINRKDPALVPNDFYKPTFIGLETASAAPSQLHMSTPYFYNEYFELAATSALRSNTVESLSDLLCPPKVTDNLHSANLTVSME